MRGSVGLERGILGRYIKLRGLEDVEKRGPLCTVTGNVNWYSHYRKQYEASSEN